MDSKTKILIKSAIASALVLGLSTSAFAVKTPEEIEATKKKQVAAKKEKCAGRVVGGLNDCPTSQHACAGMGFEDNDSEEFIWMPIGTCERLVDTHVIRAPEKKKEITDAGNKKKKSS